MQIEESITLIKEKYISENEVIQKGYYVMFNVLHKKTEDKDLLVITNKRMFHFDVRYQHLDIFFPKHVRSLGLSNAQIEITGYDHRDSSHRFIFFYQESETQEAFQLIAKNIPL